MTALTTVPTDIIAGDSYEIKLSASDYPSTAWTGSLYVSSSSVVATIDGEDFLFALSSAFTTIAYGTYAYTFLVTSGSERHTIETGFTNIQPNPASPTSVLSHQETMIRAIEAVLEGRLDDGVDDITIAGRRLAYIPVNELLALRAQYMRELQALRYGKSSSIKVVPINFV